MKILPNIEIVDLALYIEKEQILVMSDLHIGYEEALNKQGIFIPRFHFKDILEKIKNIIKKVDVKRVVFTGDLKHEFGTISGQEWKDILSLFDFLKDKEIIIIKGNHDKTIKYLAEKRKEVKIRDCYKINDVCILHGDAILKNNDIKSAKTIIIGHEHPVVSFRKRSNEKFKCFMLGEWYGKKIIVMPSMNPVVMGSDITKEKLLSPFLNNIDDFDIYVVEDKVYHFGKLKKLKLL
ncbi:MAG: metallophosphoesterase [Nanoarchaeota archaeon]